MAVYLITGATGYVGSMLIQHLLEQDWNNRIIALVRNRQKAKRMLGSRVDIVKTDLTGDTLAEKIPVACDYIIHCASITNSAEMASHPVEVIESIVNTTQNILEFARRISIKSMVYLSSMEVYGQIDCSNGHRVTEKELGDVELFSVRSCYPLGKRMAEHICYCYFREYGVPVKIARLAQTFGRGVLSSDRRVFVQFAGAVRDGKDIVLHTKGRSMGNYCGIDDVVKGIMTILEYGMDGEAYNVVNEKNTMTIRQMAELVAERVAGGRIGVTCDLSEGDQHGYAPDTGLCLSSGKLEGLGWQAEQLLTDMYRDVLESI